MAKKKSTKKKKAAASTAAKAPTKSQVLNHIAEETELTRKDVAAVFDSLSGLIKKNLGRRGPGVFTVPGLCKMTVKKTPARPARKGINPFTGEEQMFKAKPASKKVRIRPLKGLNEMV